VEANIKKNAINVFIHVPKTAGSTVNDYLQRGNPLGASHAESWINNDSILSEKASELDWVSGHIPFPHMQARLSAYTSRPLLFFTVVRDPFKQLMSHYNWLIEIFHRGEEFYNNHPPIVKEISSSIRSADNNNPEVVANQIMKASSLFLNQQSRFVLGKITKSISDEDFNKLLSVYKNIATEISLSNLVEKISGRPYLREHRVNVSPYHFDQRVFESEFLKSFIEEHHVADLALYRHLTKP